LGAPLGAALADTLFGHGVGPFQMMQLAAALLVLHLVLYRVARRSRVAEAPTAQAPIAGGNGFALVLKSRYLTLIAALLVLLNLVNTVGEFILARAVVATADAHAAGVPGFDKQAFIGTFYGNYFFWVNVLTILIQAFLVSRLVKRLGMAGVVLALPVVALGAYGVAAAGAGLLALRVLKTAENATDYSVMNTAKQMLWLPTSREEKYKAKQAIDTFFVRTGDLLAALVVFVGTHVVTLGVPGFAWANIVVVIAAGGVGLLLLREYVRLAAAAERGNA
jgi:AAA family ATP:ADP antiporter